jgi:hypothetical protein
VDDFTGERLKSGRTERVYGQFDMLKDCGLDGDVSESVIGLVDIGGEQFGGIRAFFDTIYPNLQVGVIVCENFIRIIVYDWLEGL